MFRFIEHAICYYEIVVLFFFQEENTKRTLSAMRSDDTTSKRRDDFFKFEVVFHKLDDVINNLITAGRMSDEASRLIILWIFDFELENIFLNALL